MQKFGLIGYPLGHSFSVPYFSEKFKRLGMDATYRNFPLNEIGEFENLMQQEPDLAGLNVTVPYKQKIIPCLDALDPLSRKVGAVNTIAFCHRDGRVARIGYNTDVTGFRESLEEHLTPAHQRALVLGTGGSSLAVVHVLNELGIPFLRVSRSRGKDRIAYNELTGRHMEESPLIINTTPLGMYPRIDESPPIPYDRIGPGHLLFDLVYNPEKTKFLSRGEERGASIVNGYRMLVYQAEASWEIWKRMEDRPGG